MHKAGQEKILVGKKRMNDVHTLKGNIFEARCVSILTQTGDFCSSEHCVGLSYIFDVDTP